MPNQAAIDAAIAAEEERQRQQGTQTGAGAPAIPRGGALLPRGRGGRRQMADGGMTTLQLASLGEVQTPSGGIADVETAFTAKPSMDDVNMLASALLEGARDADRIIQMFLNKYGPSVFSRVRDAILEKVVPNSQKEGMVRGNGGGMDDKISGMIGSSQPVAVSPGEFIVPADVVSDLGDGSSDAGSDELYKMMDRVRRARGGNGDQPPPIDARKNMPA